MTNESIIAYYDGECPFCKDYSRYLALKKKHPVELRNARDYKDIMQQYRTRWYDINKGMIIIDQQENLYHGSQAVLYIQHLIQGYSFYTRSITKIIFKLIYKVINLIRNIVLYLNNSKKIID
jgi:predicted DCC family thiol-disulfide oxidoreductase YuxK